MAILHESDIEQMLIDQLKAKGYQYLYGPDIAPDGETPMRASFEEVVLRDKLEKAVKRLNPSLPYSVQDEAVKTVLRISSPDVLANNEEFHRLLTEGVPVSVFKDGVERGERVWLVDFNDPWNNEFTVVNQFTIIENGHNRRPDVLLFVNGLPLVIFELKMPPTRMPPCKVPIGRLKPTSNRFRRCSTTMRWLLFLMAWRHGLARFRRVSAASRHGRARMARMWLRIS